MDRVYNEDRLSAFFDGELSSQERSEMEARLSESPELRRTLADFQIQRQSFAALAAPVLSIDFSERVMERVMEQALAAASSAASVTPPPFPVKGKRFSPAFIAGALSVAAMIALTAFLTRSFWNPTAGGTPPVVTTDPGTSPTQRNSTSPSDESLPDSRIDSSANRSSIASSDNPSKANNSTVNNSTEPNKTIGANVASRSEMPIEPLVKDPGNKAITNADAPRTDSNARLVDNLPKSAVYAAATSKSRPKAYRAQVGTRSEFEARLKDAGVSIYHGKLIDTPDSIPRAQPVDLLPDPEYLVVEGSEEQLAELVEKLGAQADLMLHEPKGDLEVEMLIEALCKMDAKAEVLRPAEAKEGEIAAFTLPPKALYSLLPTTLPTSNKPGVLTESPNSKSAQNPAPVIPPKSAPSDEASLYVPRILFILDVRMGETEGAASKK